MVPTVRVFVGVVWLVVSLNTFAGTVSGTVRAADSRQPLGAKVVAAYDTAGTLAGTASTDATGLYMLTLPAGTYRLLAFDPDGFYATSFDGDAESFETTPVTSVSVNGAVVRDFFLKPAGAIRGTVTGPTGPRVGATVEVYNLSGTRRGFTTTDAAGAYSLVVPPGQYKLVAYDATPSLAFSFYQNKIAFAEATVVTVAGTTPVTGIDFQLEVAARISGKVTDAASGVGLSGIAVYAYTPAGAIVAVTTTDASGGYRLSLPQGSYRLVAADATRIYAPGFLGGTNSFANSSTLDVLAGAFASNVNLALQRGATVAGVVRDVAGAPIANATVGAYNLDGTLFTSAITNASGQYVLVLAPGAYKLAAFDPQLRFATSFLGNARDFASAGAAAVAAGQQVAGTNFTLVRGGRITGTVRDGATPRGDITVAAYDMAGVLAASANTAADGTYSLVVPPGDYRVVAFDSHFAYAASYDGGANSFDETVPRHVDANATVVADIALRRGVLVQGEIVDGINVFALDAAGHRVAGALSTGGGFAMLVPAGTYKFVAIDPQRRYAITYFEHAETLAAATWVTVHGATEIRFVLEPARLRRRGVRH